MQVKWDDHTFSSRTARSQGTPRKLKFWASFHIPRQLQHSMTNETIRVQCGTNQKDKYPESKNRLKIRSKITSQHNKTKQKPLDYQINE